MPHVSEIGVGADKAKVGYWACWPSSPKRSESMLAASPHGFKLSMRTAKLYSFRLVLSPRLLHSEHTQVRQAAGLAGRD